MPKPTGVTILAYHWVDPDPGERLRQWGLTPEAFASQMATLAEDGYQVLPLREILPFLLGDRPASPGTVALTFDDGYQGLLDHALPVLQRLGFRATFFLVSDRMGSTNAWDARHGDAPRALMTWSEAAALAAAGMEIGSHSRTHPFLTALSEPDLEAEIRGSKETIEDRLGLPVRFFSYPHGLHDARCRRMAASAGYAGACSTRSGGNRPGTDPFLLNRTEISYYDTAWSFSFKIRTGCGLRDWASTRWLDLRQRLAPVSREVAS